MSPTEKDSGTRPSSAQPAGSGRPDASAREHGSAATIAAPSSGGHSIAVRGWTDRLLVYRVWLLALAHANVFVVTLWAAFLLRFDFQLPDESVALLRRNLLWVLGVKLGVFYALGQLHGWWRYVVFSDLVALLRAATLSLLVIIGIDHYALTYHLPRSVLLLDCLTTILVLGGLRASWRFLREHCWPYLRPDDFRAALLVGVDHNSVLLANQIHAHRELKYRIRGFLGTNGETIGLRHGEIPILGCGEPSGAAVAGLDGRLPQCLVAAEDPAPGGGPLGRQSPDPAARYRD
jgi:hypothetical protein